jgi:formylglycine-generating enzyme required for sulfatase activity
MLSAWAIPACAEVVMTTTAWSNTDEQFAECDERIRARVGANLLARPGVRVMIGDATIAQARLVTDGNAGVRGGTGRAMLGGRPTVISFYLGEPQRIREISAFTFNPDSRSNQDYEVRWTNNADNPGMLPDFPKLANLTTGDRVIGSDRGGLQSRFADPERGWLIDEPVDWIQFRCWPTHKSKSGDPARIDAGRGHTAYVELEVLGPEDDVVPMTAEQLADDNRIQDLASAPPLTIKDTWQETMIASREALHTWEVQQDLMAAPQSDVIFEPWYLLGPLSGKDEALKQLQKAKGIELKQRYEVKDGDPIGWLKRDDLVNGKVHDLAGYGGAAKNNTFLLCRTVRFKRPVDRDRYAVQINADWGRGRWLPAGRGHAVQKGMQQSKGGSELKGLSGTCQFVLELRQADGQPCRFRFLPQVPTSRPGAGQASHRLKRRDELVRQVQEQFSDPASRAQMRWEADASIWSEPGKRNLDDWFPGHSDVWLQTKYQRAVKVRLDKLREKLAEEEGISAMILADVRDRVAAWLDETQESVTPELDATALRAKLYQLGAMQDVLAAAGSVKSMQLAVEDQRDTFGDRYPEAAANLRRIAALEQEAHAALHHLLAGEASLADAIRLAEQLAAAADEILLANPVLDFDKLLVMSGKPSFASNWGGPNSIGQKMQILSPVRPDGQLTTIHEGRISDADLNWDGQRILFSDGRHLVEINADGTGLRPITAEDCPVTHYDACYLPNGQIMCVSNACEQAVPCTGGANVGNMHLMNADGTGERRITFDQDHNWNPVVMNDGRVVYSRWEYTDLPHYFSRLLMRMNPDGTNQREYYGSNSYWPNAMYWPRPIPGHPTMVSCVISGHHGVSRAGEMVLFDPARGRHEAEGAVQKIPGYGKKVVPVTMDQLVSRVWPRFAAPYPLAEPETNLGAGKYFLACVKENEWSTWDLCLVDVFDNITPLLRGGYMTPIPLRPRPKPQVIPPRVDPERDDAFVYIADIYSGPGLRDYPRGTIKQLRLGTHHFRYAGNGDTRASALEGGWDVKRIMGTVPVNEDGSCLFQVPANTPIFVQPLDDQGKAQQIMRSWFTAMPGEVLSCVGCHERQNDGAPPRYSAAAMDRRPARIEPWHGPTRGFSFEREVQPVLDRRCVGCHNDKPYQVGEQEIAMIDFRAKRLWNNLPQPDPKGPKNRYDERDYSPAYLALQKYVRRPGFEADYHMPKPAEYEADTSALVQLLKKGHYAVRLTDEEWRRLYTWIDYNIPYPGNWTESHRPPPDELVERRAMFKKLYAGIDDRDEENKPLPPVAKFEPPRPEPKPPAPLKLHGWPLTTEQARQLQSDAAGGRPGEKVLDLGDGVMMEFVLVPAGKFVMGDVHGFPDERQQAVVSIDRPFYMGRFEVTNAQYGQFDGDHNSGVINERWKDRSRRGTPIDAPELPVVRINWHRAMAFCRWLSERTGQSCTLPTEAQWEWACRAGTGTQFATGEFQPGMPAFANIADETARKWNHDRAETGYNDGVHFTAPGGRFAPNAWGLYDLHGNVAEWCLSTYKPYPYTATDGRDDPATPGEKVVRGGSWNDTLKLATSAARWRYLPYKPVYNVGFRVVVPATIRDVLAAAGKSPAD